MASALCSNNAVPAKAGTEGGSAPLVALVPRFRGECGIACLHLSRTLPTLRENARICRTRSRAHSAARAMVSRLLRSHHPSAGRRCVISAKARIVTSVLLSSCATPPASVPSASRVDDAAIGMVARQIGVALEAAHPILDELPGLVGELLVQLVADAKLHQFAVRLSFEDPAAACARRRGRYRDSTCCR